MNPLIQFIQLLAKTPSLEPRDQQTGKLHHSANLILNISGADRIDRTWELIQKNVKFNDQEKEVLQGLITKIKKFSDEDLRALLMQPDQNTNADICVKKIVKQAQEFYKQAQYQLASDILTVLLMMNPSSKQIKISLAIAEQANKHYSIAYLLCKELLQLEPKNAVYQYMHCISLVGLEETEEAAKETLNLKNLIAEDPECTILQEEVSKLEKHLIR